MTEVIQDPLGEAKEEKTKSPAEVTGVSEEEAAQVYQPKDLGFYMPPGPYRICPVSFFLLLF